MEEEEENEEEEEEEREGESHSDHKPKALSLHRSHLAHILGKSKNLWSLSKVTMLEPLVTNS